MGARILVVEDEPADAERLVDLLRQAGHEVKLATTGEEGLATAREWKPGLVLCDLVLPDVGGVYISLRMKSDPVLAGVPIVAITSLSAFDTGSSVVGVGFAACIAKPYDPQALLRQVDAILSR
jgi:two-component system cell cycle response regulator